MVKEREKSLMDKLKLYEGFLKDEIQEKGKKFTAVSKNKSASDIERAVSRGLILSELDALQSMKNKLYGLFPRLENYKKQ